MNTDNTKQRILNLLEAAIRLKKDSELEAALIVTVAAINRICAIENISFETFVMERAIGPVGVRIHIQSKTPLVTIHDLCRLLETSTTTSVDVKNEDWLYHMTTGAIGRQTFEYLFAAVKRWAGLTDTSGITDKLPYLATDAGIIRLQQGDNPEGPFHR